MIEESITLGKLEIKIESPAPDTLVFYLSGVVDEHFQKDRIPQLRCSRLILDLAGIQDFNSVGIREWVHFLQLFKDVKELIFRRCSITMVDQLNMVGTTRGHARIESMYAPYFRSCDKCADNPEINCLIEVKDHLSDMQQGRAPVMRCQACQLELEFDAIEESYFQCVKDMVTSKAGS